MTAKALCAILMQDPDAVVYLEQVIDYISGTTQVELTDEYIFDVSGTTKGILLSANYAPGLEE